MESLSHKRAHTTDESTTLPATDRSDVSFSTDPSQQDDNAKFHYIQRSRQDWVDQIPKATTKSDSTTIDPSQTLSRAINTSPEDILDSILQLVTPKPGKRVELRKLTRDLRTILRQQDEELKKDCPTAGVPKEALSLSSGVGKCCKQCGHNHILCELHRIGHVVYGTTASQRKHQMVEWMNKGSSSYQSRMQEQMRTSWLAQLLQDITTRVTIQRDGRKFEVKTTVQVHFIDY